MEFETWEPVYEAILADFGYDRTTDERARDLLAELLTPPCYDIAALSGADGTVAIAGGAERLTDSDDLERARDADVVFAASDAATRLRARGVTVDCMVTDLDGEPDTARELAAQGTPVAVHAHGDNIPALRDLVPDLPAEAVIPTTQARPTGRVHNVGGFTDGDRAAFLADSLGAGTLAFPGWAFDDPGVDAEKRQKLRWAERLLYWLERRRDERFAVLDGRRDSLSAPGPVG